MYRETYVEVNLKNLKSNIETIIEKYKEYKYRIAVVKADCYGHGMSIIPDIIESGANYLAVSSIEEALEVRKYDKDIPVLIIVPVDSKYFDFCFQNNFSITICSLKETKEINNKVKIHLRINSGNDDLNSFSSNEELLETIKVIEEKGLNLEGLYTHIFCAPSDQDTKEEIDEFLKITKNIDLTKIPMIHIPNSEALALYNKLDFVNGFRMGAIMYGINNKNYLPTFKLIGKIINVRNLNYGESIGYDKCYTSIGKTRVAVVNIGYGDGFSKANEGNYVYINEKKYLILGVFMDLTVLKVDDNVKHNDMVEFIRDNIHLTDIANYQKTVFEEITCCINKRVPRKYIK